MLEKKGTDGAWKAIATARKDAKREDRQREKNQIADAKRLIAFMVDANSEYGDDGLYAGFRFVKMEDVAVTPEDQPYLGAFLPIQVARKYPALLVRDTLDCEEIMSETILRNGTRMIVGPMKFKEVRKHRTGWMALVVLVSVLGWLIWKALQ